MRRQSIVVEITPRVRVKHPTWTDEHLALLRDSRVRVRVRGWLMLDQMHPEQIERHRRTLWEVHPIMHIDWQRDDGTWVSLDTLTPTAPERRVGLIPQADGYARRGQSPPFNSLAILPPDSSAMRRIIRRR